MPPLLPIEVLPSDTESVSGYMLRLLSENGASVREALALHRGARRRHVNLTDAELFSDLAGVPVAWFQHRTPQTIVRDRWTEVELFGHRWRDDWLLRGLRQQICPLCLREQGFARMEWDLIPYTACHIHGIVLQDTCRTCTTALAPDRPSLDVCRCGSFLARTGDELQTACSDILAWSAWLSARVVTEPFSGATYALPGLPGLLVGTSADGAYRLIQALAGGPRAFLGERIHSDRPWLSTHQVNQLLQRGLEALSQLEQGRAPLQLRTGTADGLAEQSIRGVTAWDRAVSSKILRQLKLKPRWRNVRAQFQHQLNLFEDPS